MTTIAPTDLVCATEIARLLGVQPSAVSNWRKRDARFPKPWGTWASGDLWLVSDVKAWHERRSMARDRAARRELERLEVAALRLRGRLDRAA